jgi:group I intron endonuclease
MICHQYKIRQEKELEEKGSIGFPIESVSLHNSVMRQVPRSVAKALIVEYEWLKSIPPYPLFYFGLYFQTDKGEQLGGVLIYTKEYSANTPNWDKYGFGDKLILLARGVCLWWTPKNAGSYFISAANRWLYENTPYRVVTATVDPMAGEIGTIYQACNWRYVGLMDGNVSASGSELKRFGVVIDGKLYGSRTMRRKYGTTKKEVILSHHPDAKFVDQFRKRRYFCFLGGKREKAANESGIRHLFKVYPKRDEINDLISSHYGVVYKITNTANGKVYIGQTLRKLENRIQQYRKGQGNPYLNRAFEKYGFDRFTFEVIYDTDNILDLNEKEVYYIAHYDSTDKAKGYNLHEGGRNCIPSMDTRAKMSESHKGRRQSAEWVGNRVCAAGTEEAKKYGKPKTEAEKRCLSDKLRGDKNYWYGKEKPAEMRDKISKTKTGVPMSQETYRKFIAQTGVAVERTAPDGKVTRYDTLADAAADTGVSNNTIKGYCNGKFKNRKGYTFRYAE